MQEQDIPYGYCHCGCGQKTNIARQSLTRYGWVKGEPLRFVYGHHLRDAKVRAKIAEAGRSEKNANWRPRETLTRRGLHRRLNRLHPRAGMCAWCGRTGRTDYALIHGHEYSAEREDYIELCHPCHNRYDKVQDFCKRGHALTPENSKPNGSGKRTCRICANERIREWRARCASSD